MNTPPVPLLSALLLLAAPMSATAQTVHAAPADDDASLAQSAEPPQKTSILVTFGNEPCPEAEGEEIIVCAQQPESERYRVPKSLRGQEEEEAPAGGGSWASRVEGYDNIARATRPDSCSPVGSYGFSGCAALALRQWFEARRAP
ncbi:MAG: hypothetical protein U0S50_05340 [Sphingopyxis sp.]|uniref:hypothetical protein n=1 Tax=Sphingopyxis sp. TaxID=1908224 RepID=UPI002ABB3D0E|nr:hypothetical protein [Sphingopyxis sp.]MDZ3831228.1 hypothetical protein [Sphingopyxis sp.]